MTRFILARIPVIFVVLFVLGSGAALAYQFLYLDPARQCEEKGMWWAERWRVCVSPVEIEQLTGRPNPSEAPALQTPAADAAPQP